MLDSGAVLCNLETFECPFPSRPILSLKLCVCICDGESSHGLFQITGTKKPWNEPFAPSKTFLMNEMRVSFKETI